MDRANNPPEHLPSEESKWMATNDYGYGENVAAKVATPMDQAEEVLQSHGEKVQTSFENYSHAANALSRAQSDYDKALRALNELKERYQKAFFVMNENIEELNAWLNSRQKSQSEDS